MHITRLQAENFKKIVAIDIRPGAGIVPIRGKNAQGKSSTLDAIQAALGGKSVMPSRPVRQGESEGAIRIELDDGALVVRRTFDTEGGGTIVVENADGFRPGSPQKMLDSLYASVAFDPLAFTRLKPEDQFGVLRKLVKLDVDIDALAAANQKDYDERRAINRDVKDREAALPALRPQGIIPEALLDEDAIAGKIEQAGEHNLAIERRKSRREQVAAEIVAHKRDIEVAGIAIQRQRAIIAEAERLIEAEEVTIREHIETYEGKQKLLDDADALPEPIDTTAVATELRDARMANQRFQAAARYKVLEAELEARRQQAQALTERMEERDNQRGEAIARAEMPVPGLSFGEGEVLLNELPFDQASQAERIRTSTAIGMAGNPKLRVMLIRDGSLLDSGAEVVLAEMAATNDFQFWVEAVDESGKVGIILEDGAVKDAPMPETIVAKRRKKKADEPSQEANVHGIGPDTDGGPNPDYIPPSEASPSDIEEEKRFADREAFSGSLFDED